MTDKPTREEIEALVTQYREAWRDCIERTDSEASDRENWDGSDHNLAAFDKVMDAALSRPAPAAEVTDLETIQTLLDLLNPLHGSLDKQTYDDKVRAGFDEPPDAEYTVNVTTQQERDLTQAVLILEDRKRQATVVAAAEVTGP